MDSTNALKLCHQKTLVFLSALRTIDFLGTGLVKKPGIPKLQIAAEFRNILCTAQERRHSFPLNLNGTRCNVLCAAKDETSADIICRRFSCIFMRESQIGQIRLARRLTPDVATVYDR
jgi:hypothetical protein